MRKEVEPGVRRRDRKKEEQQALLVDGKAEAGTSDSTIVNSDVKAQPNLGPEPVRSQTLCSDPTIRVDLGDALAHYASWPSPTVIVVDGPYGVAGFPGDPPTPDCLPEWYAPHIAEWSRLSLPSTTLWFWGTEVGWASVHPVLKVHGWRYETAQVWDKGSGHIAGNVNGKTLRRFPVVTEACVRYTRELLLRTDKDQQMPVKEWLRYEWRRAGLSLSEANEACGVKNAATRKYFTQDHLWYFPPPEMMERLSRYAEKHGHLTRRPYFSLDGRKRLSADAWAQLRPKWNYRHGVTNVWREPALRGPERLKHHATLKCLHTNQKPLRLIELIVASSSEERDVVWEPFGGLCSAAVASFRLNRHCYSAEISPEYHAVALKRVSTEIREGRRKSSAS